MLANCADSYEGSRRDQWDRCPLISSALMQKLHDLKEPLERA